MDPDYRLYIRLHKVTSVHELSAHASEYEEINRQRHQREEKKTATGPTVAATEYNRNDCCWRCKQRGHTRAYCKRPPKCSRCGKDGVLTRDCHPPTENGPRAGNVAAVTPPESA
ncbi:hypothetical protein RF55_7699 [Lasius niger]|uniref:CCHC-type domain-containing protein n=1 Tax=Lasius niger TaxID=67767 RepID=A0A0J7KPX8_LASNI|nr:hypothetical protein RF55_7699 [Lasius niger]